MEWRGRGGGVRSGIVGIVQQDLVGSCAGSIHNSIIVLMMIIQLAHLSWMDIEFPLPFEHDHTHPRATPTIPKAMRAASAPRPPLRAAQLFTSLLHVLVSEMFPIVTSPDGVIV